MSERNPPVTKGYGTCPDFSPSKPRGQKKKCTGLVVTERGFFFRHPSPKGVAPAAAAASPCCMHAAADDDDDVPIGRASVTPPPTRVCVPGARHHGSEAPGDEGAWGWELRGLLTAWPWKEIRGCPGRYLVRGREACEWARRTHPAALCEAAGVHDVDCESHPRRSRRGVVGNNQQGGGGEKARGDNHRGGVSDEDDDDDDDDAERDAVCVVRFSEGGGLVSFVKTSPPSANRATTGTHRGGQGVSQCGWDARRAASSEVVGSNPGGGETRPWYIHTLNTPSGLARKLRALGIDEERRVGRWPAAPP